MLPKIREYGSNTFSSLSVRNYRLYFVGQAVSLIGTWIQMIAQTWLVLKLTNSATIIGLLSAVQFLPVLLLGPLGGLIADRFSKRRLLYLTQGSFMVLALIMAVLVSTHHINVWMVFVLAGVMGLVNVIDNPTRQTFIMEMVGRDQLKNAVSLNSIEFNLARIIGPALAAVLIAKIGMAECFYINAVSFVGVLACLAVMRADELHVSERVRQMKGQLREGFRYVKNTPVLRDILVMMVIVGTLSYEFQVVLPVLANHTFHGNASAYALVTAAISVGSVIGGIFTANRKRITPLILPLACTLFGVTMLLTSIAPTLLIASIMLIFVGISTITFTSIGNTTLQLESAPEMRGRVMALWTMAFLGSTPIGGPIIGWISEQTSPRWGLATGGFAALAAALFGFIVIRAYNEGKTVPANVPVFAEDEE